MHKLTLDLLNAQIRGVEWGGNDRHSVPSEIDPKFLSGDHLIWTSAQMLNFVLRSTALLHNLVDRSDPVWKCWSSHCRYLMIANQNQFTEQCVLDLNHAIVEHHKAYSTLYPGTETAKFHWTLHMAFDILWNGPLKPLCCLRMEARHQYFKRLIKVSNRINPLYTLASRYMRHVALARHDAVPRKLVEVCGSGGTDEIDFVRPGLVGTLLLQHESVIALCAGATSTSMPISLHTSAMIFGDSITVGQPFLFTGLNNLCVGVAQHFIEVQGLCFVQFFQYDCEVSDVEGHKTVATSALNTDTEHIIELGSSGDATFISSLEPLGNGYEAIVL